MKINEFATLASRVDSSDPELSIYRFQVFTTLAETRFSSFYDLLEAVKLLSEDPNEKQEYLEHLIVDARREREERMLELLCLYGLVSLLFDIFNWVDRVTRNWKIRRNK